MKEKYKLLQEQPTLIAQGEKCHLLGYGKDIEHSQGRGDIDILFGNYLEIVSAEREEELKVWPMNYFLQEIIDERIGANSEEFRDYISNFLKQRTFSNQQGGLPEIWIAFKLRDAPSAPSFYDSTDI